MRAWRDNVITVDPTYGMYGVCARINDVEQQIGLVKGKLQSRCRRRF